MLVSQITRVNRGNKREYVCVCVNSGNFFNLSSIFQSFGLVVVAPEIGDQSRLNRTV